MAHAIKRPNDTKAFGWNQAPTYADADRAALELAETLTDRLLLQPYGALSNAAGAALSIAQYCAGRPR